MEPTARREILLAAFLTSLVFLSMAVITPTADRLVRDAFETDNRGVMWFMISHSAPQFLLLGVVVGILSDKLRRRLPLIGLGLVGTGVATVALPWIGSFPALLAVRFLDGLFGIAALGLLMARVVDLCPEGARARGMGILMAAIPAGYLAGMGLSALLGDASLPVLFAICGSLLVVGGMFLALRPRVGESLPAAGSKRTPNLRAFARDLPRLWLPLLFGFVDKTTFGAIAMLTSPLVVDQFGRKQVKWASLALVAYWVGFVVFSRASARVSKSSGLVRTVLGGSAAYGLVLIALPNFGYAFFVAAMAAAGVLTALQMVPTMALVGELSLPDRRAANMGAFNLAGSMGMVFGLALAGLLSTAGSYSVAFATVGALEIVCAAGAAAVLFVSKSNRTGGVRPPANEHRSPYSNVGTTAPPEVLP